MRVLYFNVIEQNAGWGAECFVNKALINNGVETVCIDYRSNKYRLAKKLLEINKDFDAVLLQRGDTFPREILDAINRPKFFWASELVARRRDQDVHFSSGLFKHVFVRGNDCKRRILEKGWLREDQVSILLSGFDPDIHAKEPDVKQDIDIVFAGTVSRRRRIFLDALNKRFKVSEFKIYGKELVKIFNRAKIVLNIHAEEYLDTETRVFETLGCGSFLVTEKLAEESPFVSGVHLVEVADVAEIEEKIDYYLKNSGERQKIADCGHEEAVTRHSYNERARQVISTMEKYSDPSQKEKECLDIGKLKAYSQEERKLFLRYGIMDNVKRKLSKIKKVMLIK